MTARGPSQSGVVSGAGQSDAPASSGGTAGSRLLLILLLVEVVEILVILLVEVLVLVESSSSSSSSRPRTRPPPPARPRHPRPRRRGRSRGREAKGREAGGRRSGRDPGRRPGSRVASDMRAPPIRSTRGAARPARADAQDCVTFSGAGRKGGGGAGSPRSGKPWMAGRAIPKLSTQRHPVQRPAGSGLHTRGARRDRQPRRAGFSPGRRVRGRCRRPCASAGRRRPGRPAGTTR